MAAATISGKAYGYCRVSTDEQGNGLTDQRERVAAYAAMRGLDLAGVYVDDGISGGVPMGDRPDGARLLDVLRRGDAVVMLKLDRGFRSAADCLHTVEKWERQRVSLHIVDMGGNAIDTASTQGKFMLTVLAGAAEMERGLIRDRTRAALAVKRGKRERTGTVPFGYTLDADGVHLIPRADEQAILTRIAELRKDGYTLTAIADELNAQGYTTRRGGAWCRQYVKNVVDRAA